MHRFFVDPSRPELIEAEEHQHLSKVLRLRQGDTVELLDGSGITLAEIVAIDKDSTRVRAIAALPTRESAVRIVLYAGMLKGEKMDFLAQKATELGADALRPILMRRSVAQGGKAERLLRIAREAQKQCGRARGLEVAPPVILQDALKSMGGHEKLLVAYEGGGEPLLDAAQGAGDIGVVIGPEGGIDTGECDALLAIGALPVTLGPRILRAETASVAVLSALMAHLGEWA